MLIRLLGVELATSHSWEYLNVPHPERTPRSRQTIVEEYTYLVQMVSANPAHEKEIRRGIGMGWSAFGRQNHVMNCNLPLSLKRKVYNHCILPVLMYGSETWRLTNGLERKLRSAQIQIQIVYFHETWLFLILQIVVYLIYT